MYGIWLCPKSTGTFLAMQSAIKQLNTPSSRSFCCICLIAAWPFISIAEMVLHKLLYIHRFRILSGYQCYALLTSYCFNVLSLQSRTSNTQPSSSYFRWGGNLTHWSERTGTNMIASVDRWHIGHTCIVRAALSFLKFLSWTHSSHSEWSAKTSHIFVEMRLRCSIIFRYALMQFALSGSLGPNVFTSQPMILIPRTVLTYAWSLAHRPAILS